MFEYKYKLSIIYKMIVYVIEYIAASNSVAIKKLEEELGGVYRKRLYTIFFLNSAGNM